MPPVGSGLRYELPRKVPPCRERKSLSIFAVNIYLPLDAAPPKSAEMRGCAQPVRVHTFCIREGVSALFFVLYTGIVLVFYGGRQNSGLVFRPSMLYRAQVRSVGRGMRGRAYGGNGRGDARGLFSRLSALGIPAEGNV